MPIITVQFIKDVVANDEQKRELLVKLTDTFISVVGEVARPYVYCIIQETPQMEWSIGGKAMPDLAFLIGPEYAAGCTPSRTRSWARSSSQSKAAHEAAGGGSRRRTTSPRRCGQRRRRRRPNSAPPGGPDARRDHKYTAEEEAAMAVIRRWCDEGWTKGHVEVADELIHPNFKVHGAGGQVIEPGVEGLKQLILGLADRLPGRRPAGRRHDGRRRHGRRPARPGRGPTSASSWARRRPARRSASSTIGIDRVVDGKVVEGWGQLDMLGLLTTIGGMVPASTAPAAGGG